MKKHRVEGQIARFELGETAGKTRVQQEAFRRPYADMVVNRRVAVPVPPPADTPEPATGRGNMSVKNLRYRIAECEIRVADDASA